MKTELYTISKIFTDRILRIPDYQRGYAWTVRQYTDFWNDLVQLEAGRNHYTGVITLEEVPLEVVKNDWPEDLWIIESKGFAPFHVVDGQQRLTTTVILIQAILESVSNHKNINYTPLEDVRKRFIYDSKDDGFSRSYIFGYEKDNPSYEFLKRRIYNEKSEQSFRLQETVYTSNLENAKNFFASKLADKNIEFIESIFKKLTQSFLYNAYSISKDVDVFIAFETMNNRGKPLSQLELLKNRLIYLSTRFEADDHEKSRLRYAVNETWKSLYHALGKNKEKPLDDDAFLGTHTLLHFGFNYKQRTHILEDYRRGASTAIPSLHQYLLETKFSPKSLVPQVDLKAPTSPLTIKGLYEYVRSLKDSVEIWYELLNPEDSNFSQCEIDLLKKLNRIGISSVLPLVLATYQKVADVPSRIQLLQAMEKLMFLGLLHFDNYMLWEIVKPISKKSRDLLNGKLSINEIIQSENNELNRMCTNKIVRTNMVDMFRRKGFYAWRGIRYFLFEYELSLKNRSKSQRDKIDWAVYSHESKSEVALDYVTIEHIYPQNSKRNCWTAIFSKYSKGQRTRLRQSLGNMVPLSSPKNSSLQDKCFLDKVEQPGSTVGFRYGSYAENEIAGSTCWTEREILQRGLRLLEFMERRWSISLGDLDEKMRLLGLEFLPVEMASEE